MNNNKDLTLLIMAAGMGSRYGGLKQIEPVGPNQEFLIDYSIYDAIKVGFKKVVFIIKEENYELFEETVGKRVKKHIPVEYAFQRLSDLPEGFELPKTREKPWGTAHAILSAKNLIKGNFIIINADDFYGRDAYLVVKKFLDELDNNSKYNYALVGYKIENTLTNNGSVKRGICKEQDGYLTKLTESIVEEVDGKIIASPLNGKPKYEVERDTRVSTNMFAFTPEIFNYIEDTFPKFLNDNKDNLDKCEFLIPDVIEDAISKKIITTKVLKTSATWQGVTYKSDKPKVVAAINKLIEEKEYPEDLWNW